MQDRRQRAGRQHIKTLSEGNPAGSARMFGRAGLASLLLLASVAPSHSETLYEALTAAFHENPGLNAERLRQRADEENVRQAIAGFLPEVTLDAEKGNERTHTHPRHLTSRQQPGGVSFTLNQPLFKGLRTFNGKKKASAEVRAGQFQLDSREQSVLLDTVTAFVDVLRDRKIKRLRGDNVTYLQSELTASRARHRSGDLSKTDVAQARTRVYEGKADQAQAEADLAASEARFVAVIGHAPGILSRPRLPEHLVPRSLGESVDLADAQNPDVESARERQEAARREKMQAYGELLPTVSLEAKYDRDYDSSQIIDDETESSIYLRLNLPLYQGGTRRSKIRQTAARESSSRYQVTDTRRRTRALATDAWQQSRAARTRITSAKLQVEAARDALKGVTVETKVGERAFFEILDAQRELVNAEVSLARATRDLYVANYSLLATVGRLRAHLLNLPGADLEVEPAKLTKPARRKKVATFAGPQEPASIQSPTRPADTAPPPVAVRGWSATVAVDGWTPIVEATAEDAATKKARSASLPASMLFQEDLDLDISQ